VDAQSAAPIRMNVNLPVTVGDGRAFLVPQQAAERPPVGRGFLRVVIVAVDCCLEIIACEGNSEPFPPEAPIQAAGSAK
jgi:hypothetical protein